MQSLSVKVKKSREVILKAIGRFSPEKVGVCFTGGKDSIVVLHLIRETYNGRVPFKVIRIDTSVKFPENTAFVEKMKKLWHLDLHVYRNEDALNNIEIAKDKGLCCQLLKTVPLKRAIMCLGLKALVTGIRWDESTERSGETYFSERTNPGHTRIHPILHFGEQDIWNYIRDHHVPYCSLYQKGYRSLGCAPCTEPSKSMSASERDGRSKDKEDIMNKLRNLGYF